MRNTAGGNPPNTQSSKTFLSRDVMSQFPVTVLSTTHLENLSGSMWLISAST